MLRYCIFRSCYIGWQGRVNYFSLVTGPHRYCHIQWLQVNIYRIYVRMAHEIQAFQSQKSAIPDPRCHSMIVKVMNV